MSATLPPDRATPALDHASILAALPLTAIVFDASGIITWANQRVEILLDPNRAPGDSSRVIGRNVVDLVHPDDQAFALQLLSFGRELPSRLLGPIRLRYVDAAGRARYTDFWAQNQLDNPAIRGYVVQLTEETTQHRLAEAVTSIAEGSPLEAVFDSVAHAMEGFPMEANGAVLHRDARGDVTCVARFGLPDRLCGAVGGPWDRCFDGEASVDVESLELLPPELAARAAAFGLGSVWCRTVPTPGPDRYVLVCWRADTSPVSPNQAVQLRQAVAVLRMAINQEAQRRQLEQMAYTDALTGLANRAHLYEIGSNEALSDVAVLFVDLDGFKQVNDLCGHEIGDRMLRHVARILRKTTRSTDEVIRLGGDEFVVLCPPPVSPEALSALAERIIGEIAEPVDIGGHAVRVGASVGIVHFDDHDDLDDLLRDADAALYLAKAKGRGKWWMAPVD